MIRKLGLSSYLYEEHLFKNGFRFFFDTPECDTPLHEMSEIGSESLPFHPAFQIDRSRLDSDLLQMAAGAGVEIGGRISGIDLASGAPQHAVRATDQSGARR